MLNKFVFVVYLLLLVNNAIANTDNSDSDVSLKKLEQSQWELGIGATVLNIPFYPGSSQSKTYLVPVPHFFYHSKNVELDKGLQLTFLRKGNVQIDLSADFGLPVNSTESTARKGLPDIDLVLQIGPSTEITLAGGQFKLSHTRLEFPVRAAVATDFSKATSVGWIIEPRVTYETHRPYRTGLAYLVSAGLRFATDKYHDYYYAVGDAFATPTRPSYDSSGGYSGLFVDAAINWRTGNLIYFTFLRYQNLSGTAFEDSSLVEQKDYFFVGAGLTWVFARNL
jgi:outer membrane scaffolding protein for murein synthesis (MipA/OmpV family)